jgi:GDPmannose 4,6-dehydratase/GDP-L-fucose synthase
MRTFVAGHRGMVGSALLRKLHSQGAETIVRTRAELDLLDPATVQRFFRAEKPDRIIIAAAKVGGIHANNSYPADFIFENLMIECNLIHGAFEAGIRNLLFLGSSCIYPRDAAQPLVEEALLTGPLEPTNEAYAIAKIAGIKLCESYNRQFGTDYRSVMPTNLYGPNDNFDLENSHVLPGLMARFHKAVREGAEEVLIWGSGRPRREFLHVDDLADACLFVMGADKADYERATGGSLGHINVGSGQEVTIAELAEMLRATTGFSGRIGYDAARPDGTPRKLLDRSRLTAMGWQASIGLEEGINQTYQWFLRHVAG